MTLIVPRGAMRYENGKLIRETRKNVPVYYGNKIAEYMDFPDTEPEPEAEKLALYVIDKFGVPDSICTSGGGYIYLRYNNKNGLPWRGNETTGFSWDCGPNSLSYKPLTGAGFAFCRDHCTEVEFYNGVDYFLGELKCKQK